MAKRLLGKLFWLVAVAAALLPVMAEAMIVANHNETVLRDFR